MYEKIRKFDADILRKIKVSEKSLGEFEMIIKYVNRTDDGKLKLKCIKPDGKLFEIPILFSEEDLKKRLEM